jgi:hypothetical protein
MDLAGRFFTFLITLVVVLSLGGILFLAMWDIPPPTERIEKVLPNDRFPS